MTRSVAELEAEIERLTNILYEIVAMMQYEHSIGLRFYRRLKNILFSNGFAWHSCAPGPELH